MKATLEIKMDNAAFDEPASELGRILRELAEKIENDGVDHCSLFDFNGNKVGSFGIIGRRP